jgi:ZIP family zinc transporter
VLAAGLWSLLAASSLLLGAAIALRVSVPRRIIGEAMGFGAGALVGSLAYELIPAERVDEWGVWLWFGAGAITFYVADGLILRRTRGAVRSGGDSGVTLALGALLDGVPESLVLGMGLAVGGEISIGFLVAVFVSNVPEALSASRELRQTRSSTSVLRLWAGIAAASAVAGALGFALADALPSVDGSYVQAFAGGAVLTMLVDSMIPEASERGGRTVGLVTALGFAVAALLTLFE